MKATLLLNASFEPLHVISWQKAVTLSFLGKVEIVDEYEDEIHSVAICLKVPAVVRLLNYVGFVKKQPPFSRLNLLIRDEHACQYCRKELNTKSLTIDHILPKSQGGQTTWENIVAACNPCNRKKGGRTPEQANMKLAKAPRKPEWLPVISLRLNKTLPHSWTLFLREE